MKSITMVSAIYMAILGSGLFSSKQDPLTDLADFYYAGKNNELAAESLFAACQRIPSFEEVEALDLLDTLKIVTNDGRKFLLQPKMVENGLDRIIITQWFNPVEGLTVETGSVFCNRVNSSNNYISMSFSDDILETQSNLTFGNLLRAENLLNALSLHRTATDIALNQAYPEEGWNKFIK